MHSLIVNKNAVAIYLKQMQEPLITEWLHFLV